MLNHGKRKMYKRVEKKRNKLFIGLLDNICSSGIYFIKYMLKYGK